MGEPAADLKGEDSTRPRILAAAEAVFAQGGYGGASMREIALGAGVAQGLIHYHFGSKADLYAAVIAWRTAGINAARATRLNAMGPGAPLETILDAFYRPALDPALGGTAYVRVLAMMVMGSQRDRELIARHYDPIAERFIAAIRQAEPHLARADAAWGYGLTVQVLVAATGHSDRIARLAEEDGPTDHEARLARLVRYASAGIRAMGADQAMQNDHSSQSGRTT